MKPNRSRTLKLIFDVILLAFLALMYRKQAISMPFHELGGLALGVLFIVHKLVNLKWIRGMCSALFRKKGGSRGLIIVDLLLLAAMAAVLLTGLFISKTLPTALRTGVRLQVWHYFAAAVTLALTGIHLGLHWPLIRTAVWDKFPLRGRVKKTAGIVLLCALLAFGVRSFVNSSVISWFTRPFTVSMNADGKGDRRSFTPGQIPTAAAEGETDGIEVPGEGSGTGVPGRSFGGGYGMPRGAGPGNDGRGGRQTHGQGGSGAGSTMLTFSSIILLFASLTALIRSLVMRRKRSKAIKTERPAVA